MSRRALLVLALLAGACRAPESGCDPRIGVGPSFLPNIGVAGNVDWRLSALGAGELRADANLTQQFLDDEDFVDDGNESAGDWTQISLGLRYVATPDDEASWESFVGPVWFHARGEPNIIDEPGRYVGVRAGLGYHVRLSPRFSMGPSLAVVYGWDGGGPARFPQLTWDLTFAPGR